MARCSSSNNLDERRLSRRAVKNWPRDLKGLHDLLCLTQPQVSRPFTANTWKPAPTSSKPTASTRSSLLADYGMESLATRSIWLRPNAPGAPPIAVMAADPAEFVSSPDAMGRPTKPSSISTDVNNPQHAGATI